MMKLKSVVMVLSLFCIFSACDTEDDSAQNPQSNNNNSAVFTGKWFMIHAFGGIGGAENDIQKGKVVWNFNSQDSTVVITNNYDNNMETHPLIGGGAPTGTYEFSLSISGGNPMLFFDNNRMGSYSLENDTLIVDQIYTGDGFTFKFIR